MAEEMRELYEYNRWANRRLLAVTGGLSHAQLTRDLRSSFPSVLDTLAHMLAAEWMWLSRWKGSSPIRVPEEWDLSSHEALVGAWSVVESDLTAFVEKLTDDGLRTPLDYRNTKGAPYSAPLWQLMRHVVNHASYHRGQVVTMLRQLGVEPVTTDLVQFHRELAGRH